MILIPIGHEEQGVRRLPWVSFGLMAACLLVLIATGGVGCRYFGLGKCAMRQISCPYSIADSIYAGDIRFHFIIYCYSGAVHL